jgi:hypothetical protein
VESTRFTIFHVLWAILVAGGAVVGWIWGGHFGAVGSIAGGAIGVVAATIAYLALRDELHRRWMKQLQQSTSEELRAIIGRDDWKFEHTMALLNLAARGEDVRCELPRILSMLESDSVLTRRFGWDALRIVFDEETRLIGPYEPRESTQRCRDQTAALRERVNIPKC